jgi:hypothetical protein
MSCFILSFVIASCNFSKNNLYLYKKSNNLIHNYKFIFIKIMCFNKLNTFYKFIVFNI